MFDEYVKQPIALRGSNIDRQLVVILMTFFSVAVLAYIFIKTDRIPLYTLLIEGDSEQASIDRITARRNFQGISHIKNLLGLIMIPVISYYTYILFRKNKTAFNLFFFLINLVLALLLVSYDIQKAPIAFYVLGYIILEVFISKGISLKKFGLLFVIPLILLLIGYNLTQDKDIFRQLTSFNSGFYIRAFLVGYFNFPLSLELFPDVIVEPTYAVGIPSAIIEKMEVNSIESARLLKMYIDAKEVKEGTGNLYSGFFMGEAWANYGYLGLVVAPMVVGLVIHTVHLFVITHQKNAWILAFYAVLTVKWLVGAGFSNFFYLKLLIWPLVLYATSNFVLNLIFKKS